MRARAAALGLLLASGCVTPDRTPAPDAGRQAAPDAGGIGSESVPEVAARASSIHAKAIVVDGHNDLPWRLRGLYGLDLEGVPFEVRGVDGHTDLPRLREGGVDVQFWAAWVPVRFEGADAVRVAREQIDLIVRLVHRYPADLELALSAADIRRIVASGRIASLIGVEGGHAIDHSLEVLREFHDRGARYLTLTHSATLDWVDAAGDVPRNDGLSAFGREVVAEMNRLGMLVDLSHVTDAAMHDVLDVVTAPVIFSHSSARALADHPRNVPDEVLRRMPSNGGIVMVNFFSGFLTPEGARNVTDLFREEARIREASPDPASFRAAMDAWYRERLPSRGTVATIVDHIDHIVRVAGIDHVGLGSDFDGVPMVPEGMEDVSRFPAITVELLRRGYREEDVRKILGENLLRVLRAAEAVAGSRTGGEGAAP